MTYPILALFLWLILALLLLGVATSLWGSHGRRATGLAAAGLAGLGVVLSPPAIWGGTEGAVIALPIGLPGMQLHLALDPLSAFFLLIVLLSGCVGLTFAVLARNARSGGDLSASMIALAGLMLAILGDGPTLAIGLAIAGLALWTATPPGSARTRVLAVAMLASAALFIAQFLRTAAGTDQAHPALAVLLTLAGAGALAGLVPMHRWLVPAHRAPDPQVGVLLTGAVVPTAIYCMMRLLFTDGDPAPASWGLVVLLAGGVTAVLGPWCAATRPDLDEALAFFTQRQSGLVAIGVGLALVARAADLPDLAALALGAALLLTLALSVCGTAAILAGNAVRDDTATTRLDRLGGLIHTMPVSTTAITAALFSLSALPPGVGFAGIWLVFQGILAAPRGDGFVSLVTLTLVVGVLAVSAALAGAAAVRLVGVACLGRPRGPRTSAAVEIPPAARYVLFALLGGMALLGVVPGLVLRGLAEPVIRAVSGSTLASRAGLLGLAPGASAPGYAPLPLVLLLAAIALTVFWLTRKRRIRDRVGLAWSGGFAAASRELPFGDPLTQSGGEGFVPDPPVRQPRWISLPAPRLPVVRIRGEWTVLALVSAFLVALVWYGGA